MIWVPIAAWAVALMAAVVVLGFCAYELNWKANRLRRDLGRLQQRAEEIETLRGELAEVQERLAATSPR